MSEENIQFLGSELKDTENQRGVSRFQILPCPLEKTVTYGSGTSAGPAAIIRASQELERSPICQQGIFTQKPIDCSVTHQECLQELYTRAKGIVRKNHFPITLGGEHSLTWATVRGISDAIGEKIGIVQVDAHADLRYAYGGNQHSHASVMNLLVKDGHKLASLGVRAICEEEKRVRLEKGIFFVDAEQLVRSNISSVELPADFPQLVYISFDLDGLDPAVMPAVGTPVPGGLSYYQAIDLIESVLKGRTCVGLDVVELAPVEYEIISPFTAASLVQKLLELV
ncbi:MAG: agmatinase [Opitutae bacterium]